MLLVLLLTLVLGNAHKDLLTVLEVLTESEALVAVFRALEKAFDVTVMLAALGSWRPADDGESRQSENDDRGCFEHGDQGLFCFGRLRTTKSDEGDEIRRSESGVLAQPVELLYAKDASLALK